MIVVDASVAVKWFVPESGHDAALGLLESGERREAPDVMRAETMHALRRKVRARDVREEQYSNAGMGLPLYCHTYVSSALLVPEAAELSLRLDHGFYDCLYLALAITTTSTLIKADEVFATKASAAGFGQLVRGLGSRGDRDAPNTEISSATVADIARLAERFSATLKALEPPPFDDGRFRFHSTSIYNSAFQSPAYLRLKEFVLRLSSEEMAQIIALGWLGRSYERGSFSRLVENARHLAGDPKEHLPYILSVMSTVGAGYDKFARSHFDGELKQ